MTGWQRVADDGLLALVIVSVLVYWYFRDKARAIREDAKAERERARRG
jgi:cbb3-type cytochrome oxidase subunit 3